MDKIPEFDQLQFATDRYLDQHAHSDEAYVKVTDVINKFDFMVTLAVQRALEELYYKDLPSNVIPLLRHPHSPDSA